MSPETLEALKGSIKKWEAIVAGTGKDEGTENCPLCKLFYLAPEEDSQCLNCPVQEKTGHAFCKGTPYEEWVDVAGGCDELIDVPNDPPAKKAAEDMLAFLKGLLP